MIPGPLRILVCTEPLDMRLLCRGRHKSHTRKYFLEALHVDPLLVREPFQLIQTLFALERQILRAPPPQRAQLRRDKSGPVVEAFFAWCVHHAAHALDESPLHAAIRYATNQREALTRFVTDARLPMHNNVSERELRRQAIGRNYAQLRIMRTGGADTARGRGSRVPRVRIIRDGPET